MRMQLHNISESSELDRPYHYPTPKETLFHLTDRISNEDLKQAIQQELTNLVNEYDQFISVLQQRSDVLEQEYENLQITEESYQRRYEKAVREMQFFKKKYMEYQDLPTSPLPSSISSDSSYHPPNHLPLPPPPAASVLTRTSSSSSNSTSEIKHVRKPSIQPEPAPTLTRSATNTAHGVNPSVIQQRKVDPLVFGGSDSFWETIAKSPDTAIEKMIR